MPVTVDWEVLRTGMGSATMDCGPLISATAARRVACDCQNHSGRALR
jgi:hypothetical protein